MQIDLALLQKFHFYSKKSKLIGSATKIAKPSFEYLHCVRGQLK